MKKEDARFFFCKHCGNLVGMIQNSGVPIICCGEEMEQLVPNTTDAAQEKHVPVIEVSGQTVTVKVGSVPHPMLEEHYIQWIYLLTEKGAQRKDLLPGEAPEATFAMVEGNKVVYAMAYCNLHSLWMKEI